VKAGWESGGPTRVAADGGADSMLCFGLKRVSDRVLASWEGSMARYISVTMLARGETTPGRGKGGDDTSWANTNLIRPKIKKIHAFDLVATNER
jgi:hypothetical protein